jgi:hypothetical protein
MREDPRPVFVSRPEPKDLVDRGSDVDHLLNGDGIPADRGRGRSGAESPHQEAERDDGQGAADPHRTRLSRSRPDVPGDTFRDLVIDWLHVGDPGSDLRELAGRSGSHVAEGDVECTSCIADQTRHRAPVDCAPAPCAARIERVYAAKHDGRSSAKRMPAIAVKR